MAARKPLRFDAFDALVTSLEILSRPPAKAHITRTPGKGRCLLRLALPLELCPTTNGTRHGAPWKLAMLKSGLLTVMLVQLRGQRCASPLPGRPMLRCIRFSSSEPDAFSDGFKMAIDRLIVGKNRIGYLRDDRPSDCEVVQWWEYAPPGKGFAVLEIWSGES